jgi:hypothetical protein
METKMIGDSLGPVIASGFFRWRMLSFAHGNGG